MAVDGIPPLEAPRFVTADAAQDWINPRDDLIGVVVNGDARAYPIRIIAWHEMVNDTIGGIPVSLAYCTLCGSAIVYDDRIGDTVNDFGTSGLLYRSNKLMYDRQTDTLWEQFSGRPAWGPLVDDGLRLTVVPSVATTWQEWVAAHPDTVVLDIDTGFARDYSEGAAYAEYNASPVAAFNTPRSDDRLPEKAVVHVLEIGGQSVAYPIAALDQRDFILHTVGGMDLIIISTPDGSGARAYANSGVDFASSADDRQSLADASGGRWAVGEDALTAEDGRELARIAGRDTFWFAFVNLAQDGLLWEE